MPILVGLSSCDQTCDCPPPSATHQYLSDYGFFQGALKELEPAENVVPYDLINPLFSDYAQKDRFVYVPEGTVTYRSQGVLDFPQGAVLIKNFSYTMASGETRHIETRLLRKTELGWQADTYLWNQQQTEAELHISGASVEITYKNHKNELVDIKYLVPDKNQCKTCHSVSGEIELIGPSARNLNVNTSGGSNQLQLWQEAGILEALPDLSQVPDLVSADDIQASLADRARAYLDINCGHCHNPLGSARNSGLFLHYDEDDPFNLGYCKLPVAAVSGKGGSKYVITPGNAATSIMWYRMNSNRPSERMPELGRTTVHQEGVELIQKWIDSLEEEDCG